MAEATHAEGAAVVTQSNDSPQAAWARASYVATVGLFLIALGWVLYAAHHVVVPVAFAWAVATIVQPLVSGLIRLRIPRVIAAVLVTAGFLFMIAGLVLLLSAPIAHWLSRAAEIGALLREKLVNFNQPLALLEELRNMIGAGGTRPLKVVESQGIVSTLVTTITPVVSQLGLFIGSLLFCLIYQQNVRSRLVQTMPDRKARLTMLRTLNDIDENMTKYFGAFTIVSICLGIVTAGLTWFVSLPNPLLWGVLAALLNYIPYLGPATVAATLFLVSLLVYSTVAEAVVPPLAFLGVAVAHGLFLGPALMGQRKELNPFAVFLAIALCTWMWGPLGAFLAVPLLMSLSLSISRVFGDNDPALMRLKPAAELETQPSVVR